jgi:hypothetical protein
MITNAKIRKVETDFRGVSAAFYTYQDRFNRIPGDDNQASTRFGDNTINDGNGNGILTGAWNRAAASNDTETLWIWEHLRAAGLISGEGVTQPTHAYGGIIGLTGYNPPFLNQMGRSRIWVCFGNISGDVASVIETRGDDGNPITGSIIGDDADTTYTLTGTYNPLCMRM